MAGRTAARSSVSRDQASSPTKPVKRVNKSRSPTKRMNRTTRSASRELDEAELDMRTKKTKKARAVREESADSAGSVASIEGRTGRKRKNARAAVAVAGDLSMVAEEQEKEQPVEIVKATQSPGGMSNLSGTTAPTSQSEQKIADLDIGIIAELIPDLSREAFQILDLLAPSKASSEFVEIVIKELQVPGSGRGRRLRHRESIFDATKENYGSDLFIDPALILRKLFGDQEPGVGNFRPDVILHAANITILVRELLVAQRDNPSTMELLQRVDDVFPMPFLSGYGADPIFGNSALFEPTFRLAVELRTQTSIAIFKVYRDELNFDPDELLGAIFYTPPTQRSIELSSYEDLVRNGRCRNMGGVGVEAVSFGEGQRAHDYQKDEIYKRVEAIREAFNAENRGGIDYVDFDKLHDSFPWTKFLASIVQWCQLRLDEINRNIEMQGGIDNITGLLVDRIKGSNSQIELYYEPPKATQPPAGAAKSTTSLPPGATIIPASAGKSLYNSSKSLQALLRKPTPESSAPPSNQEHPAAPVRDDHPESQSTQPTITHEQSPERNLLDNTLANIANTMNQPFQEVDASDSGEDSIQEVISLHYEGETYNHKENEPSIPKDGSKARRLRFVDRQPNAERVSWSQDKDDDNFSPQKTRRKRSHQSPVESDDDEDHDAFETDSRPVDRSRREQPAVPVSQAQSPLQRNQASPKRPRTDHWDEVDDDHFIEAQRQRKERRQEEQQAMRERIEGTQVTKTQNEGSGHAPRPSRAHVEIDDDDDDNVPTSSYALIKETARAAIMKYRVPKGPQQRTRWSEDETDLLINLIDKHGCSWVRILEMGRGHFAESRDQVALKDKARNLKVDLLIAGAHLPRNFNGIALGKKEREKVKAARMNPYRLEGESVGGESRDMDGNLLED